MDVILRLFGLAGVFVDVGEGVCGRVKWSACRSPQSYTDQRQCHSRLATDINDSNVMLFIQDDRISS